MIKLSIILVSVLYFCAEVFADKAPPRPNIVHTFIDDLGWQDIASHKESGTIIYETPHMDKLTKDGMRFM
ncbi:MAG: hypothetical protein MK193_12115 [Lentisphaeria bacterium]|nr:hypothetical protein [Lentisphaeria bacterium]